MTTREMTILMCLVCRQLMEQVEARQKENWQLGDPATIEKQDGIWYLVPHAPDCATFNQRLKDLKR